MTAGRFADPVMTKVLPSNSTATAAAVHGAATRPAAAVAAVADSGTRCVACMTVASRAVAA
jgi:hypothetical protein